MRILIAGDTHCNLPWVLQLVDRALEFECKAIFVLGDFGYWPKWNRGKDFLFKLEHALKKAGVALSWLDGNHEDHDALDKIPISLMGVRYISDHVIHTPRGYGWTWGETSFVALGGAVSIDQSYREKGTDWFPQEVISERDEARASRWDNIDVLLSHDSPLAYPRGLYLEEVPWAKESFDNRMRVQRVAKTLRVKKVFHGHLHHAYRTETPIGNRQVGVEGLSRDECKGSWTVFDA